MTFTTLQRKTTILNLLKNWGITYISNMCGCLFVAGFLGWWTDTFSDPREKAYAVSQANGRVNVQWSVNFLRGVGCNMFVALAMFLSLGSVEFVSKIYSIWIPVWLVVLFFSPLRASAPLPYLKTTAPARARQEQEQPSSSTYYPTSPGRLSSLATNIASHTTSSSPSA